MAKSRKDFYRERETISNRNLENVWLLYGESLLTSENTDKTVCIAPNIDFAVYGISKRPNMIWLALNEGQVLTIGKLRKLTETHNILIWTDIDNTQEIAWLIQDFNDTKPSPKHKVAQFPYSQADW